MELVAAYALFIALGLAAGFWEVSRLRRRYPESKVKRWPLWAVLTFVVGGGGAFLLLSWVFGDDGLFLSAGAGFVAAVLIGHVLWPTFRPSN